MEIIQNTASLLSTTRKNSYLCSMEKEKEINWLFPDANTKVSLEDYQKKIFEDEHSGDMSFKEFKERLETWLDGLN